MEKGNKFKLSAKDFIKLLILSDDSNELIRLYAETISKNGYCELTMQDYRYIFMLSKVDTNNVINHIFGNFFNEFPEYGRACLVSNSDEFWILRYSNGKNGFYKSGKKEGECCQYKQYKVLPVNLNIEDLKIYKL